jgi:tetratricopeptide (TPR) repeat protein
MTGSGRISRAALWGIPGVGKTQIALRFSRDRWDQYTHIFYVHAISAPNIGDDYRMIARRLRLLKPNQNNMKQPEVVDLVKTWLSEHSDWLLIFDNALEPGTVRRYTPLEGSGHMIFTTRSQIAAEALVERAYVHEVPVLPFGPAVQLGLKLQGLDNTYDLGKQAAERLAQLAGGLPIAIEQTVSLACLRKVPLASVLPELERRRALLKQSHPNSMHEEGCSTGAILALTLDTLKIQSPQSVALFRLLVYFNPSTIPTEIITQASAELKHHFARLETYDRGLDRTPKELKEMRIKAALARLPFYYQDPFKADFWRTRVPFWKRLPANTLPRIDSEADRDLERFFRGNIALQDVLEKQVRIENAFLDLRNAGLIRQPDDKTIWIHDLFAQLTIALLEEESRATHQVTAHFVLLMIYFRFPLPGNSRANCFKYLPHAISIIQHCRSFYNDLTIGPELAHMTAAAFRSKMKVYPPFNDQQDVENTIFYYKLAFTGYHHAWRRLRDHPLVTEKKIVLCARAEYAEENSKGIRNLFPLHHAFDERFGSLASSRALQTCLTLGERVYGTTGRYEEAVRWTEMAVTGFQSMYGEYHRETHQSRAVLLRLYKRGNLWNRGYVLGRVMVQTYMERFGEGLLSPPGALMASNIGDCLVGLWNPEQAARWYDIARLGFAHTYGDSHRSQLVISLKIANLEGSQHAHGRALRLAKKALKIYHDTGQAEPGPNPPLPSRVVELEVAIARQEFELGNMEAAKDGCERALQICKWDPQYDHSDFDEYRSVWDSGLEAVWLWGCIEFSGQTAPEEWDVPNLRITKDLSKEALEKYRDLREPCCGREHGSEGWNPGHGITAHCQKMLAELEEMEATWSRNKLGWIH